MKHTQLQIRQYPQMIEEFAKENFNLKTLAGALIAVTLANTIVTAYLLRRGPMVVPLQADGSMARVDRAATDAQVQAATREYLSSRYTWTNATIGAQLKRAEFFIGPQLVTSFQKAMGETLKYVREKKVTQRVYPRSISVSFKDQTISVLADRITEFDGLKAATEMSLILNFELQDRTAINPWGVFIVKETEKALQ